MLLYVLKWEILLRCNHVSGMFFGCAIENFIIDLQRRRISNSFKNFKVLVGYNSLEFYKIHSGLQFVEQRISRIQNSCLEKENRFVSWSKLNSHSPNLYSVWKLFSEGRQCLGGFQDSFPNCYFKKKCKRINFISWSIPQCKLQFILKKITLPN